MDHKVIRIAEFMLLVGMILMGIGLVGKVLSSLITYLWRFL